MLAGAGLVAPMGSRAAAAAAPAIALSFTELFEPGTRALVPSSKLLGLNGKRVRLVGFMARLESPLKGAFFLTSSPVYCDESGGGTADLPPETVRVVVRSLAGKPIPYTPRLLEVTGILSVGNQAEPDGSVSALRLVLDRRSTTKSTTTKRRREP